MRRFKLVRSEDVSGVSGLGTVAEGIRFSDGTVSMRWITPTAPSSTVVHESMAAVEWIHGHEGRTTVEWVD
jgi:hypothetical protein